MYILECANGLYYTGSTIDIDFRIKQHEAGEGSNFTRRVKEHQTGRGAILTRKHLPVKLVYYEECEGFEDAFLREKQVQRWSRKKKEALINDEKENLPNFSRNYTQYKKRT